jgi:aconitate hydratase
MFPSDDTTRAWMEASGRGREWRGLEAASRPAGAFWTVRLGDLEPLLAPLEQLATARALRAFEGTEIRRVLLGPGASLTELADFAHGLEGGRVHERVECAVVVGSRWLLEEATAAGTVGALAAAGVSVTEGEVSVRTAGTGTGLCLGVPHAAVASGRARWLVARADCCALAAREGVIRRPGPQADGRDHVAGRLLGPGADPWLRGETSGEGAGGRAGPRPRRRKRKVSSREVGGEVLAVLGDGTDSARVLRPGARYESLRGHLRALAGQVLEGTVPRFGALAQERGGGVLVAGSDFGRGEPQAAVAVCLAELGVRTVVARSYAPGAEAALAHAGVVPLLLREVALPGTLECGDELELSGVPESLVPGRAVVGRNLTRGTRLALGHGLAGRDVEVLRAGGIVPHVLGEPRKSGG